jgi:hypothetical protein
MYKDTDRYTFPNKWVEQDFEKLQILVEKAQKEKEKKDVTENNRQTRS